MRGSFRMPSSGGLSKRMGEDFQRGTGIPTKGLPLKRRSKGMGFLNKGFYKRWTVRGSFRMPGSGGLSKRRAVKKDGNH